jgi:hypothetical protein
LDFKAAQVQLETKKRKALEQREASLQVIDKFLNPGGVWKHRFSDTVLNTPTFSQLEAQM